MADFKFEYAEDLLKACAHSALAAFVANDNDNEELQLSEHLMLNESADHSCTLLHQQHAQHFGNPPPEFFQKKGKGKYHIDGRLRQFLKGVLNVYVHNSVPENLHTITLNQFTDNANVRSVLNMNTPELEGSPWESFLDWNTVDGDFVFTPFEGSDVIEIEIAANLTVGHGGMGHLHHTKKHRTQTEEESVNEKIKIPERGGDPNFAVPIVDDPDMDGDLLRVKPRHHLEKALNKGFLSPDTFALHLDWATDQNPDGVPIVKDAIDQVSHI